MHALLLAAAKPVVMMVVAARVVHAPSVMSARWMGFVRMCSAARMPIAHQEQRALTVYVNVHLSVMVRLVVITAVVEHVERAEPASVASLMDCVTAAPLPAQRGLLAQRHVSVLG